MMDTVAVELQEALREEAFALATDWGQLSGTLCLPAGARRVECVLLVAGSGPTDRDGNNPLLPIPFDHLKLLAHALAAEGFASLRFDKRGVGGSPCAGLREETLRFDDLAEDVLLLVRALRADPRITGVVLAGHSEGALVAKIAAGDAPVRAVVSLCGAGERASTLIRRQLHEALPSDLELVAQEALDALERGERVADVPDELMLLFRPSVQPYLISWFRHDPAQLAAGVGLPLLLLHGADDLQVPIAHAEALHVAQPRASLHVFEGMDHLLALHGDVAAGTRAVAREMARWLARTRR